MGNQIEFRHFKYFLAVAEDLHFRKAAERLYISQPGLSRQIKQLEDELGMSLFKRHNRKVELTKAGEYLKKSLSVNFKQMNDIINHAKLLNEGVDGNLKIGYVGSAMQKLIPELLLAYKEQHPNIIFTLKELDNTQQIHDISNQEIDIGFIRNERVPRGLNILPLQEETFSLVLPKSHPINESNFNDLAQLKNEPVIFFDASYSQSYYEKIMQIYDSCGFSPLITHYSINASTIFRLVENNFGISIVPTSLKLGYDLDIKFIELTNIPQRTRLKAIWSESNSNPILKSFINVIPRTK